MANCNAPVTSIVLTPEQFPPRLVTAGWKRELRVRGTLTDGPAVAIVGSRAASRQGMDRAHAIAKHVAARHVQVISGGALGIDGAAHRGALAGGGVTTVVLGSGVDVAYPRRHAGLFDQIVAGGGALVSMLPDGTPPRPHTFPQRNPLIAALADVVVVVEADVRSGSLSTARAARGFGKVLCAWPGSRGCEALLATGAAVVEHPDDVIAALDGTPRFRAPAILDPIATAVRDALDGGVRGVDALVRHTGLTVRAVLRALVVIESSWRSQ